VQKQGGEVVDLAQKTFCEFTIADHESHFQGSRASLVCDLPLATFSKEIARKTRMHTRGLSPDFLQGLSPSLSRAYRSTEPTHQEPLPYPTLDKVFTNTSTEFISVAFEQPA
jgi:hypothetical protein